MSESWVETWVEDRETKEGLLGRTAAMMDDGVEEEMGRVGDAGGVDGVWGGDATTSSELVEFDACSLKSLAVADFSLLANS